jgi:hypothetical protein
MIQQLFLSLKVSGFSKEKSISVSLKIYPKKIKNEIKRPRLFMIVRGIRLKVLEI